MIIKTNETKLATLEQIREFLAGRARRHHLENDRYLRARQAKKISSHDKYEKPAHVST
jgi:hypothetical protein